MHIVGKDKANIGKFAYEVFNGNDLVEFGGGYLSGNDAQAAAQMAERALHMSGYKHEGAAIQNDYMSLEDVLEELGL